MFRIVFSINVKARIHFKPEKVQNNRLGARILIFEKMRKLENTLVFLSNHIDSFGCFSMWKMWFLPNIFLFYQGILPLSVIWTAIKNVDILYSIITVHT